VAFDFEVSAMHLNAMARSLELSGVKAAVVARVSPATRDALSSPWGARWQPSIMLEELSMACVAEGGEALLEKVTYDMTKRSFGPIVSPMLKVALALTGRTPKTLLARLDDSVKLAMRGVVITWADTGPRTGTVTVRYPRALDVEVLAAWRGGLTFMFELAGEPGWKVQTSHEAATTFHLALTW
jgi:hypothetical protein